CSPTPGTRTPSPSTPATRPDGRSASSSSARHARATASTAPATRALRSDPTSSAPRGRYRAKRARAHRPGPFRHTGDPMLVDISVTDNGGQRWAGTGVQLVKAPALPPGPVPAPPEPPTVALLPGVHAD